jgi:hypothetical protein
VEFGASKEEPYREGTEEGCAYAMLSDASLGGAGTLASGEVLSHIRLCKE